jgi:metal-responsive CopG/Arc/MetJ family transcriptional regulator
MSKKCIEEIKVHVPPKLKCDLQEIAAKKGYDSMSTFVRQILREYTYGNLSPNRDLLAGSVRD